MLYQVFCSYIDPIGKSEKKTNLSLSMDFVSQEHGVPRDGPKDSNAGG
jgi:hypothetical protein